MQDYTGIALDAAISQAIKDEPRRKLRIAFRDGKLESTRTNHDPERLNFAVEKGIVVGQALG